MKLILASKSPRRKELMEKMGLEFDVMVSNADETVRDGLSPDEIVQELAYKKAKAVLEKNPTCCVIGSDTIVVYDNKILGKPHTKKEAIDMLNMINGKTHFVYTGIAVVTAEKELLDYDKTEVEFSCLTPDEIIRYAESGEPMDKAGAYGVQGEFCKYVKRINGSYFSVMGLPVNKLYYMLKELDLPN